MVIIYPTKERRNRLVIGGILYIVLGGILAGIGLAVSEPSLFVFAGLVFSLGFIVSGVRHSVCIDANKQTITQIKGWYFILLKKQKGFADVDGIHIEKQSRLASEFSNLDNEMHRQTIKTLYRLSIHFASGKRFAVDATAEKQDAEAWASQIAETLDKKVQYHEQELSVKDSALDKMLQVMKVIAGLIVAGLLLVLFFNLLF